MRYNDVQGTSDALRQQGPDLAAVIVEPMLQSGGCIPATPDFLRMLRAETEAAGVLLIFDEVVTSRLHPGGIHGALGLRPDLVTLGKYLGGGFAFGAFGGDRRIMARFDPRAPDHAAHAGTFNNNPLTLQVAFAALSELYPPAVATALNVRGDGLRESLNALARTRQVPLQFTGLGSVTNAHMTRLAASVHRFLDRYAARRAPPDFGGAGRPGDPASRWPASRARWRVAQ